MAAVPGGSPRAPEADQVTPATSPTPPARLPGSSGARRWERGGGAGAAGWPAGGRCPAPGVPRGSKGKGPRACGGGRAPDLPRAGAALAAAAAAASPAGGPGAGRVPPPLRFVRGALPSFPGRCAESRGCGAQSLRDPQGVAAPRRLAGRRSRLTRGALLPTPAGSPQLCPGLPSKRVPTATQTVVGAGEAARGEGAGGAGSGQAAAQLSEPRGPRQAPAQPPALRGGGTSRRPGKGEKSRHGRRHRPPRALLLGGGDGGPRCQVSGKADTLCPKWIIFTKNSLGRKESILPTIDCRRLPSRYGSKTAPGDLSLRNGET